MCQLQTCGTLFRFPKSAVLKKVQQLGPSLLEPKSFFELFAIHEIESTPFTKAPSKGNPSLLGTGRGSSNAARSTHIELKSSLWQHLQQPSNDEKIREILGHCEKRVNLRNMAISHEINSTYGFKNTFICLAIKGKPDNASKRFAHFPVGDTKLSDH